MSVWVKKTAENSGDLIVKRLRGVKQKTPTLPTIKEESRDIILNRLISGEGKGKERDYCSEKQSIQLNSNTWSNIIKHEFLSKLII